MSMKVGQGETFKVLVALPKDMVADLDVIAREEYRGRSDLIREALRRYMDAHKMKIASRNRPIPVMESLPMVE